MTHLSEPQAISYATTTGLNAMNSCTPRGGVKISEMYARYMWPSGNNKCRQVKLEGL